MGSMDDSKLGRGVLNDWDLVHTAGESVENRSSFPVAILIADDELKLAIDSIDLSILDSRLVRSSAVQRTNGFLNLYYIEIEGY